MRITLFGETLSNSATSSAKRSSINDHHTMVGGYAVRRIAFWKGKKAVNKMGAPIYLPFSGVDGGAVANLLVKVVAGVF